MQTHGAARLIKNVNRVMAVMMIMLSFFPSVMAEKEITGIKRNDVYESGDIVINKTLIDGDFVVIGNNVTNSGEINGDYIAVATSLVSDDKVRGNIRAVAQQINISGLVSKNVSVLCNSFTLEQGANIARNINGLAASANILGMVTGDISIVSENLVISGRVNGDVNVSSIAGNARIELTDGAVIDGSLTCDDQANVILSESAVISGGQIKKESAQPNSDYNALYFMRIILTTLVYFLLGCILYKILPRFFVSMQHTVRTKFSRSLLTGVFSVVAMFIFSVIAVFLLLISFLFISPSVVFIVGGAVWSFYLFVLYFSTIPAAIWVGNLIFKDSYGIIYKFAAGLSVITIVGYLIELIISFQGRSTLLVLLLLLYNIFIALLGTGVILVGINDHYRGSNGDDAILV